MTTVRYLIEAYHKNSGGGYSSIPDVVVKDGIAFDNDKSIESTADSFQFRVANVKNSIGTYVYREKMKIDDRVLIYITSKADITDANKSTYQRFDGLVTEVSYEVNADNRIMLVKGLNRFEKMLNFVFPAAYRTVLDGSTVTASGIIQNLIGHVNDGQRPVAGSGSKVNQIAWDSGNSTTTTEISFYRLYRPVYEMIEELSRQNINKEFNAYYYVDNTNNFIWKQKSNDSDTIKIVEGTDFNSVKITERVWDVINAMIVDCGKDPRGLNIHTFAYNELSAADYGLKWSPGIEVETEIAEEIKRDQFGEADADTGKSEWVENTDITKTQYPDSYPFTMSFNERGEDGDIGATNAIATSDATFSNHIRKEAKWVGSEWAQSVLNRTGKVRPKVDLSLNGSLWEQGAGMTATSAENVLDSSAAPIQQGDLVKVIAPSYGYSETYDWTNGIDLRVVQINHQFGKSGWFVTLRLEEDTEDFNPQYTPSGH